MAWNAATVSKLYDKIDSITWVCNAPASSAVGSAENSFPILRNTAKAENGKTIIANVSMGCVSAVNKNKALITRKIKDRLLNKSYAMML